MDVCQVANPCGGPKKRKAGCHPSLFLRFVFKGCAKQADPQLIGKGLDKSLSHQQLSHSSLCSRARLLQTGMRRSACERERHYSSESLSKGHFGQG